MDGGNNTNVHKINDLINDTDIEGNQYNITRLYFRGVGTNGRRDYLGKSIGDGSEQIIRDFFEQLRFNRYNVKTDKIYLFGYSRGAMIAKLICSMSDYTLISKRNLGAKTNGSPITAQFEFVGLFDPICGNYLVESKHNLFLSSFPENIKSCIEICSLDETRILYHPALYKTSRTSYKRIWMPGEHCDIGGDSSGCSVLGTASLLYMIDWMLLKSDVIIDESSVALNYDRLKINNIVISKQMGWWRFFHWRGRRLPFINKQDNASNLAKVLSGKKVMTGKKYISNYFNNRKERPIALLLSYYLHRSQLIRAIIMRRVSEDEYHTELRK